MKNLLFCSVATNCLCLSAIFLTVAARSATIRVPADQPRIQAGIDAATSGDTVVVAPGTYYERIDFKGKAITVKSSDGPSVTILDGGGIDGEAVVSFMTGEVRTSVLSGFTVQNGGKETTSSRSTGGIYIVSAAPTISNNIITANKCVGIFAFGGALIQGNTISATQYDDQYNSGTSRCEWGGTGVTISGTTSVGGYDHVELIGNTIQNNTKAIFAGGVHVQQAKATLIQDNIISNNSSPYAGGIAIEGFLAPASVVDNLIYGNTGGFGGAAYVGGLYLSADQSIVTGNTLGGNAVVSGGPGVTSTEVDFGMSASSYVFSNNIVVGTSSTYPALNCSNSGTPAFDHNDVYNPKGAPYGGACSDQTGISGNISANPVFVNPGADFHLTSSSPAIDSGNNNASGVPTKDLDGQSRVQDATKKGYAVIDMGAYEYPGQSNSGALSTVLTSSLNPSDYGQSVTFIATVTDASLTIGAPTGNVTFGDGTATLATSPLSTVSLGSSTASFSTSSLSAGTHSISASYSSSGGTSSTASLNQVVRGIDTTTTLQSSINPAAYGATVMFTATVATGANGGGVPSGKVVFMDGSATVSIQPLTQTGSSTGQAQFSSASLTVGSHVITTSFVPTGAYAPSAATLSETINGPAQTTVTLSGSPNPAIVGSTVVFLATVSSASPSEGSPTGVVTFTADGTTLLGSQPLTATSSSSSQSSLVVNGLTLGGHAILASYNASGNFLSSTAAITETINPLGDFTITAASPNITVQTQHHLTTSATLSSLNGFSDTLTFSCGNLPEYLMCQITPATTNLARNGQSSVSIYIDTSAVIGYMSRSGSGSETSRSWPTAVAIAWPFCFLLVAKARPKTRLPILGIIATATFLLLTASGCSSKYPNSTLPGAYQLQVRATGVKTGATHVGVISLIVTQ